MPDRTHIALPAKYDKRCHHHALHSSGQVSASNTQGSKGVPIVRYGVTLLVTGVEGNLHKLVELACRAEDAGWDGIFLEDYISFWAGEEYPVYDPWLTLAAIAARTERIRLGITVTPLARRRPWKVAREAVTLDHLSHGRLILGVGLGDSTDKSFTAFGEETDPRRRAEMLDESLEILAGLWSGAPFHYDGQHYHIEEVTLHPRPVQAPRIPIWVGGWWPRPKPALRAARWDGYVAAKVPAATGSDRATPDDVRAIRAFMAGHRSSDAPFDIVTEGETPGNDPGRARVQVRPYAEAGLTWWVEYDGPASASYEAVRMRIEQGPPRVE